MKKIILNIEGMTCSACSNGLEKYLNKQKGIKANVNLVMSIASIEYDDNIDIPTLEKYIVDAGFKSRGIANFKEDKKDNKKALIIYGILGIILMFISMSSMIIKIPYINIDYPINYSITLLILTIPFLYYGYDILRNGIKNMIHLIPNMDTLVTLGVISSFLYSLYNTFMILKGNNMYVHHLYYESVAFVIYFIKLGRLIEGRTTKKTKSAIENLVTITPNKAKLKKGKSYIEVNINEVNIGDTLVCLAGEKYAVDGIISKGSTHTNESFITGESIPIKKGINDKVIAGSLNYEGIVEYKATKIGKDTLVSNIVNMVVESSNEKMKVSKLADKICSLFVPIVIVISFITFIVNFILTNDFSLSLTRFVSILVISCPCALGLATPLCIMVTLGICSKEGILIRNSSVLEIISKIDTVVFDKTGTLTNGSLKVNKFYNFSKLSDKEIYSILGSLEINSNHPIGKSIIKYIEGKQIKYKKFNNIRNIDGIGIKGNLNKDIYYVGNRKVLNNINNPYLDIEDNLTKDGNSIVYICKNNEILGIIGIKDTIRKESLEVIKYLKKRKINTIMLTGDNDNTARKIANDLGIDNVISNCLPSKKEEIIKNLKKEHTVCMIGDGINDAPSLTNSDVSISIGSGTDIAKDSSDIILMNDDLTKLISLFNISKKVLINIKENLFWAFFYNILMIPLAAGMFNIEINPMIASIAMILSSFFVSLNALRLKKMP